MGDAARSKLLRIPRSSAPHDRNRLLDPLQQRVHIRLRRIRSRINRSLDCRRTRQHISIPIRQQSVLAVVPQDLGPPLRERRPVAEPFEHLVRRRPAVATLRDERRIVPLRLSVILTARRSSDRPAAATRTLPAATPPPTRSNVRPSNAPRRPRLATRSCRATSAKSSPKSRQRYGGVRLGAAAVPAKIHRDCPPRPAHRRMTWSQQRRVETRRVREQQRGPSPGHSQTASWRPCTGRTSDSVAFVTRITSTLDRNMRIDRDYARQTLGAPGADQLRQSHARAGRAR